MNVPERFKVPIYLITVGTCLIALPTIGHIVMTSRHQDRIMELKKSSTLSNYYVPDEMKTAWGDRISHDLSMMALFGIAMVGLALIIIGLVKLRQANHIISTVDSTHLKETQSYRS